MKQSVKKSFASCLFLFMLACPALQVQAAPAADEVVFNLRSEDITTQTGQIRRVYFNLLKGSNALPVCLTTTIEYDTSIFEVIQNKDIVPSSQLNRAISPNTDENYHDIIRVGVGVEDYDDNASTLPDGDLFSIDFHVLPGVTPIDDSVAFSLDIKLGPNQAGSKDASLLRVVNSAGVVFANGKTEGSWNDSTDSKAQSCFINVLTEKLFSRIQK